MNIITADGAQRETSKSTQQQQATASVAAGGGGSGAAAGAAAIPSPNQPPNDINKLQTNSDLVSKGQIDLDSINRNGPYFDKAASKNVTALLGKTVYLTCRVKNLGNKTVSTHISSFILYI